MNTYRYEIRTTSKNPTVLFRSNSYGEAFSVAAHLSLMFMSICIVEIDPDNKSDVQVKTMWLKGRIKSYESC